MWKCKIILYSSKVINFLNENNIKPENCKITEVDNRYSVFYYEDSKM